MRLRQETITLSATDLANHLSCRHLTTLELLLSRGVLSEPAWENPHLRVLQQRGLEHERAYINHFQATGLTIVDLSNEPEELATEATRAALQGGAHAVVQASLGSGQWRGRADVLLRVERPSALGPWSYEVVDCKLARETKAETILQLCLYSELVAELQGRLPEWFHVIRPDVAFAPESYRVSAFAAYCRLVKRALQESVMRIQTVAATYPEPVSHCDICRWWQRCDQQRRHDDHLSFVAGASRLQRKELGLREVVTLQALARVPLPIPFTPSRGSREGYTRIREQARIQFEARTVLQPRFEVLPMESTKGLFRLPAPSAGDLFFDLEGDVFVGPGGLEYLFGIAAIGEGGTLGYECRWAMDRAQERATFEWFMDSVFQRLTRFPDLHIYHFGAYEPGAIKRLMLRYATHEEEVDRLLRGGIFIDLHSIVRQSIRASVEQYSLKGLEQFCNYKRRVPLPDANQARHVVENQLELGHIAVLSDSLRAMVEGYNADDCFATERLRQWLETLRGELVASGTDIPRPPLRDAAPSEAVTAHQQRVAALFDALTQNLPDDPANRNSEEAARWLLAHALDWHRREQKVKWWEFFRLKDMPEEELYDEKAAIAGLSWQKRLPKRSPKERSPIDQYSYPVQECSIRPGDALHTADEQMFGEVLAIDPVGRTIVVKKPIRLDGFHPVAAFAHSRYSTDAQSESILRLAAWIVANGMNTPGEYRAARDLLLRTPPRLLAGESLGARSGETALQAACRLGVALDDSVLPIQGPPGAGKTFTGARMICDLVRQGKKVGITAVSHKVIRKLLDEVLNAAQEDSITGIACAHRQEEADTTGLVREIGTNEEALAALKAGTTNVLGGTSWIWARHEFTASVDVLFVDEAGQMSLANVLACAPAANSLVLLGDPQQLEQPQQGSHPEGSDVSALSHLLNGRPTIDDTQGLFLAETWRLHPEICRFTSELFYEGRLKSFDGLERQQIEGPGPFSGVGLWLVPVRHDGNQSHSMEEVEQVAAIVELLTMPGTVWIDRTGDRHILSLEDILIVAPYNDQVHRLMARLPGAKVGTVDKFQGQEAPIVIYSMTTSTAEDAPRGMDFLYNPNRFNVATSRARCACIVVGNPRLFEPECHTPRQIELANILCRYVELSRPVELQPIREVRHSNQG